MVHCDEMLGRSNCSPTIVQKKKIEKGKTNKKKKPSLFHSLYVLSNFLLSIIKGMETVIFFFKLLMFYT